MGDVDTPIECGLHGQGHATYVCTHLARRTAERFFVGPAPWSDEWPDAWCEACNAIFLAAGGEWTDEGGALARVQLLCHRCYEERRAALSGGGTDAALRFSYRCEACEREHEGLPAWGAIAPHGVEMLARSEPDRVVLTPDTCVVDDEDFYVRATLDIPVRGVEDRLSFGVWSSLAARSFAEMSAPSHEPRDAPYFGWLCTRLPSALYPETRHLKLQVYERTPGDRPLVVVESTEHPLAVDQRTGITVARARAIAAALLHPA